MVNFNRNRLASGFQTKIILTLRFEFYVQKYLENSESLSKDEGNDFENEICQESVSYFLVSFKRDTYSHGISLRASR